MTKNQLKLIFFKLLQVHTIRVPQIEYFLLICTKITLEIDFYIVFCGKIHQIYNIMMFKNQIFSTYLYQNYDGISTYICNFLKNYLKFTLL